MFPCSQCSPFLLGVWLMFDDTSSLMCSQNLKRGYVYWGLCTLRLVRKDIQGQIDSCVLLLGCPWWLRPDGRESACNAGRPGFNSGLEDALEEKMALHLQFKLTSHCVMSFTWAYVLRLPRAAESGRALNT